MADSPTPLALVSRLRWQCRRGMLELDDVLLGYLEGDYATAPAEEQATFRDLLTLEDPVLNQWILTGDTTGAGRFETLVRRLRRES